MDTNLPTTAQAPMIALIKTKNIMNDNNLKTKTKRAAALLLLLALLAPWAARAQAQQTLTLYDGTDINQYVPVYGYWADAYQKCEFVIPANQLTDMNGCPLSQMTFYLASPASEPWTGTFQVFLKEVNYTTLSAFSGTTSATIVYEGTLDGTQSTMTVDFDNNYTYGGGNLLVGVYETVKGNYKISSFFGQTVAGACVQGYSSSSLNEVAANQRNFIPKTTFTYTVPPTDPCLITITPDAPYIEDFESPQGTYMFSAGPMPDCWDGYCIWDNPHNTYNSYSQGQQSLVFYHHGDSYAILPKFSTAINLLKISFWEQRGDGLQLGYITAADNGTCNTFTAIETYYGGGSVWTQHVTYLSDVPETAHRLAFKWIGGGSNCFIDYVEVTFFDGCYNVGTLSTSDLTAHSVHLSWDLIDDSQTEWNVQVANNADFTENLVEYLADSHEDYLIDNLNGGTVYYVRVGPTCSEYGWSNTIVFATQCDGPITVTADAPYTQGFEDGLIPGCWDVYAPEGYDAPSVNNYSHSGSYSLYFTQRNIYAVLPEFDVPLNLLHIRFWFMSTWGQLQLGYITAEDDGTCNTFTAIENYTTEGPWVECNKFLFNLPATAHRLAFKVVEGTLLSIDDVEVAIPALDCYPLGALGLGRLASNSAYLSWEVYDAEQTEWDVQVATDANFTENVANHVADSHENYLVEGLDPDTYYYVRVKPTCSDDLWSSTVQFWSMPSCNGPITVTADGPYTEGFENPEGTNYNELGRLPACWESYTTGTVGPHNTTAGSSYVHGGTQSLSFYGESETDTYYAILPEFSNPLNELQISFWLRCDWGRLQLGYLTAEDEGTCNTFTAIADFEGPFYAWTQHTVYLPNVPEAAHRLAFKWSGIYDYCFIDDLEVSICTLDCFPVGALSVDCLSSTSAYLSWKLFDNSQTAWNVQLATDATFTNILVNEETDSHENYLLDGLGIATQYYVRVKPTCNTDLWNTIGFTTLCGPYEINLDAPYTQGFESPEGTLWTLDGPLPPCWVGYNSVGYPAPHNTIGSSGVWHYVHSGAQSLSFHNDGDSYAVLPEFSNLLNQLQVSFWMRTEGYGSGQLRLGYITADDDGTCNTFTEIASYNSNTDSMLQCNTVLGNVPAEAWRLVFKWSGDYYRCFVDDVEVSINPALALPHNIAAANITSHTTDITWEGYEGTCDSYALRYRVLPIFSEGFEGGTMPEGWTIEGASQNPAKTWRVGVGDSSSETGTHSGNYNALITYDRELFQEYTYLVMPALDLGESGRTELSFWYINRKSSLMDYIAVCYRIGDHGAWRDLWSTTSSHATWTSQTVELTGLADNYQIGFRYFDRGGHGVGLDDIVISGVALSEWITVSEAESPHTLTGLTQGTSYEVQVKSNCAGYEVWSESVVFTTLTCEIPVDMAVNGLTATSATVSWTGFNDSYNVRLGTFSGPGTLVEENFAGAIPTDWDNSSTYPWTIVDGHMQSSNAGVHNSTSTISLAFTLPINGTIAFDAECKGEGSSTIYDKCIFSLDGEQQFCYGANMPGWNHYSFEVAAGQHTFTWSYEKDGSVNPTGDYFAVDNVVVVADGYIWNDPIATEGETFTFSALTPSTTYYVQVQGVCDGMATNWSQPVAFSTLDCTVPGNLAVSDITATSATLTWTDTSVDYNVQLGTCNGPGVLVEEDFAEAIPVGWDNGSNYPWAIVDGHMQSSNGGVHSTSSDISLTLTFPVGGTVEFDAECKGEGSSTIWDKCIFSIDGEQQFCYGANMPGWNHYSYSVTAGEHTFTWSYTKDGSVNPTGDYFAVDNVLVVAGEYIWDEPLLADGESITFSALTPSTTYYVQVQGNCNNTPTEWSEMVSFTTLEQPTVTQTVELVSGWNWVSFNVEVTLDDLKSALVAALPGTAISIKSQTQNISYNPNNNRWVGSLTWDLGKMYSIKVVAPCEISFEGLPLNPAEHPVTIVNGANWIGFPLNANMSLSNAFAGFAVNGDRVKSQTNNALYNGIRWQGQLNTLEPGKGYIYISNSSGERIFTFPTSAK